MTDWDSRDLNVDLSFLPAGNFEMDAYQDGANTDRLGSDYKKVVSAVTNKSKVTIKMARGGGWAGRIISARG